jgi:hypothetical protein
MTINKQMFEEVLVETHANLDFQADTLKIRDVNDSRAGFYPLSRSCGNKDYVPNNTICHVLFTCLLPSSCMYMKRINCGKYRHRYVSLLLR